MFTPSELERMPIELERRMSELEMNIMQDIVRRININDEITRSADWQIYRLQQMGQSSAYIKQQIQASLKLSDTEINNLYEGAIQSGYTRDKAIYEKVGAEFIPFKENKELQQLIQATISQTKAEMINITQTLGFALDMKGKIVFTPLSEYLQKTLDTAVLEVTTGAFDYNSTLKRVVSEMTKSGLRTVDYATGWSNRVEVATRRALMTGVGQVTDKISDDNAKQLDTEYFEVSYHSGARPSHAEWQGRVYTRKQLVDICGLGTGAGLKGWNCYHDKYPFIPGISERQYTDAQLDEMNAKENAVKVYRGKECNAYEATQRQRNLETLMRSQRQKIKLLKGGNVTEDDLINVQAKYRGTMAQYSDFSKKMNLPEQKERIYMDGLGRMQTSTHANAKTLNVSNVNNVTKPKTMEAKTIDEARELAKSELGFKSVDYGETKLDVANHINKTIFEIQEKFPSLKGIERIGADRPNSKYLMAMENASLTAKGELRGNALQIGGVQGKTLKELEDRHSELTKSGWFPKDTDFSEVIWHEYGHAYGSKLEADLFIKNNPTLASDESVFIKYLRDSLDGKYYKNIMKEAKKDLKSQGERYNTLNISKYATKSNSEEFAEAFAEYHTSSNPSKESIAIMKVAGISK